MIFGNGQFKVCLKFSNNKAKKYTFHSIKDDKKIL